jgi:hypothetical protein
MSRGVKITLVIVGLLFAIAATCVGGGFYWWSKNGDQLIDSAKESAKEGRAFGETQQDAQGCLDEGLSRSSTCGAMQISCVTRSQMFTQACLSTAPETPGMCDGVPKPDAVMDTVSWSTAECKERGQSGNQFCSNVMGALQSHCARGPMPEISNAPEAPAPEAG